jgi:alpha-tubulin suppressor-like RCC1 family protein
MCWGRGDHGELGTNTMVDNPDPAAVMLAGVTAIATGGGPSDFDASCAIAPPKVYCWGAGQFGRLGNGTTLMAPAPQLVLGIPDGAIEVVLGYDHTCARYANGDVWCWGRGDLGQLGDGKNTSTVVPVQVALP